MSDKESHKALWGRLSNEVANQFVKYLFDVRIVDVDKKQYKCRRCKVVLKASRLFLPMRNLIKVVYSKDHSLQRLLDVIDYTDQTLESIKEEPWLSYIIKKAEEVARKLVDIDDDVCPPESWRREYVINCVPERVQYDHDDHSDSSSDESESDDDNHNNHNGNGDKCNDICRKVRKCRKNRLCVKDKPYFAKCPRDEKCVKRKQFCRKYVNKWRVHKKCVRTVEKHQYVIQRIKKEVLKPIKCDDIVTVEYCPKPTCCKDRCYDETCCGHPAPCDSRPSYYHCSDSRSSDSHSRAHHKKSRC